jgi:hypothetical protein
VSATSPLDGWGLLAWLSMMTLRGNIVVEGKTFGDNETATSFPGKVPEEIRSHAAVGSANHRSIE